VSLCLALFFLYNNYIILFLDQERFDQINFKKHYRKHAADIEKEKLNLMREKYEIIYKIQSQQTISTALGMSSQSRLSLFLSNNVTSDYYNKFINAVEKFLVDVELVGFVNVIMVDISSDFSINTFSNYEKRVLNALQTRNINKPVKRTYPRASSTQII
jgi:protoheme ferro-lyase